ncbi:GNAT family N-acetyltransferase [Halocatena salina]|uniref:GNAT family N-acetyltransferase n=1 Tax=Halocatena salina TaxID=2934340 RepID=A0A8U0A5T0_9EURY|nr:GNAT family N-acetyltransferase [Halocatena salina]UPM44422.1 GNAT family N-acetyltransferase [Halocatena salina]
MQARQTPAFETPDHRRIYEYVEQQGTVAPREAAEALEMDPEQFHHELAVLKRDGYLEEQDDTIRVALEAGTAEEYTSNGVGFTIRPARQEDLAGIVGVIRKITSEKTYLVAETVAQQVDFEGVLIRHNDVETRMFFVATVADDVIGWAHLEAPELEKLSHAAKLTVGVLDEYRRHGIGGHLLHRSLEWAGSHGYQRVYNSIPATNQEAARFLEDHGFETEAIRKEQYMIDGEFTAELMMARSL